MAMVEESDPFPEAGDWENRRNWVMRRLERRSRDDRALLANRAALRVLPRLWPIFTWKASKASRDKPGPVLVLALLRCLAFSLASPLAAIGMREGFRASSARAESISALFTLSKDSYARSSALCILSATDLSLASVADAIVSSIAISSFFEGEFISDFSKLDGSAEAREILVASPLWHQGMPVALELEWRTFFPLLRQAEGGWNIWADWYEGLRCGAVHGHFLFDLPTPRALQLLQDVALIDDELWKGDPAKLNAEFGRLVEAAREESLSESKSDNDGMQAPDIAPPSEPSPSSAPEIGFENGRLRLQEAAEKGIGDADADDLAFLHNRLREKIPQLKAFVAPLANSYPGLKSTVDEYGELIAKPIDELDSRQFWAAGIGLVSHALAFELHDLKTSDKPPLEPDCLAALSEVSRLHGSLILELPKGSEWTKQADETRLPPRETIEPPTLAFLQSLLHTTRLLEAKFRKFVESVRDSLLETGWDTARQGYLAYGVVRNALIAIGRPLVKTYGFAGTFGGGGIVALVGAANGWDTNTALAVVSFVRENSALILEYAAPFPELRQWAAFVVDHLDQEAGKEK